MSELKSKTINSLKWSAIERLLVQAIQLLIMLVLARLLGPEAFGLVGLLAIFIAIGQTFTDSGFSSALIRKLDRNETDFSTTFYFNIIVSIFFYLIFFLLAPFVADFYSQPELVSLMRVMSLIVITNAFCVIQRVILSVEMDFKSQAKASLFSVMASSFIALLCAYLGFGVWTLAYQALSLSIFNVLFLNIIHPWLPKKQFSKKSFNYLFGFGSKLLLSGLLETIYKNIYQLIIGRVFNVMQVGYFSQANQLASLPAMTLTSIIQRVTYPMLSHLQDDNNQLEKTYTITLKMTAFVVFPLMAGLAFISTPLLTLLLGYKWQPAATLLTYLALGFMLYPIHAINLNILQVKGRTDLFLKLEIIKKIMITLMLIITVPLGIEAICIGAMLQSYIALGINMYYSGKFINLTFIKQIKDLLPIWLLSMGVNLIALLLANILFDSYINQTIAIVCIAVVLYGLLASLFFNDLFNYVVLNLFYKKGK